MTRRIALPLALLVALLAADVAVGHEERPSGFPDGTGSIPTYRGSGPSIVVCKSTTPRLIANYPRSLKALNQRLYQKCLQKGFRNIQAAVDAVQKPNTRILILPGRYYEKPSLAPLSPACANLAAEVEQEDRRLTYGEQRQCPHIENVIGIFGDKTPDNDDMHCDSALCGLQLEGTGRTPLDVVVDGRFRRLNTLRADRAGGIYFRNFTVQRAEFNSLYVIETDGFVIDRMLSRWNWEYAFLTFSSDHGLYKNCEAYGNGDGGLYPGSASDLPQGSRPSIEIRNCNSHHNTIGVSGTAGDNLYVHDNRLHHNMVGVTLDSFFPNHPGLPQNRSRFENNLIYSNNQDYYKYYRDGTCSDLKTAAKRIPHGVVCPSVPVPIGTGVMLAGGNYNVFRANRILDNWRFGFMQFWVPAAFREEEDPEKQYDTSNFNQYLDNYMGVQANGKANPNGTDIWWDEEGAGNCWDGNIPAYGRSITSDPALLPACDDPFVDFFRPGNTAKTGLLGPCATWSRENYEPPGCTWMQRPSEPE